MLRNRNDHVVSEFGSQWKHYDQSVVSTAQLERQFQRYTSIFPWDELGESAVGFDLGCGSGRWDQFIAARVGHLHCIDASSAAIEVARNNLASIENLSFHTASVDEIQLPESSMDFGISLGVLHHVPDTMAAIRSCTKLLKRGAPLLLYLYYDFEDKPLWFRYIWHLSDILRRIICRLPFVVKLVVTSIIAALVYLPLAKLAAFLEWCGVHPDILDNIPLSSYRGWTFYWMRTDALDRFGTRVEKRFSRGQIEEMLASAGMERVKFKDGRPYWVVLGYRR